MSRVKVNKQLASSIGQRLDELLSLHLGVSWSEFSKKLGYSNASTLSKVKSGESQMSVEKLHEAALLKFDSKGQINVDWLVAGRGNPLISPQSPLVEVEAIPASQPEMKYDEDTLVDTLVHILQKSKAK
jgi:hypothetical protein